MSDLNLVRGLLKTTLVFLIFQYDIAVAVPTVEKQYDGAIFDLGSDLWIKRSPQKDTTMLEILNLLRSGKTEAARDRFNKAYVTGPKKAYEHELDGMLRIVEGDLKGAEKSLEQAYVMEPGLADFATRLATVKLQNGKTAEGEKLLREAVAKFPDDRLVNQAMARLLERNGDTRGASKYYPRATTGLSSLMPVHIEVAGFYSRQKNYPLIVKLLEPLVNEKTQDADALLLLARAHLELGQAPAARKLLKSVRAQKPKHADLPLLLAIAQRVEGDTAGSVKKLQSMLAKDSGNKRIQYQLGKSQVAAGDWKKAITTLRGSIADKSDALPIGVYIARIQLEHGLVDDAIRELEPLSKTSIEPGLNLLLAQAYARKGRFNDAVKASTALVKANPDFAAGHALHVQVLQAAGRNKEAEKHAELTTKRFPDSVKAWIARATVYIRQGKVKSAIPVFEQGLQAIKGSSVLELQLASLLQQTGDPARAEKLLRNVLRKEPGNLLVLNNLAMLRATEPDGYKEALSLARNAYKIAPDVPVIQDTLGWILVINKTSNDQAIKLLSQARKKLPQDAGVHCHLGAAYALAKRNKDAKTMLGRCLAMKPTSDDRRHAEKLLKTL